MNLDHVILLKKLKYCGIRRIKNTKISQHVEIKIVNTITKFNEAEVNCGGPQGTILEPVLFIVYMNGMVPGCGNEGLMTQQNQLAVTTQKILTRPLRILTTHFHQNKLINNTTKTPFLIFHSKQNKNPLVLTIIKFINNTKILVYYLRIHWTGRAIAKTCQKINTTA